jgi:hypothetical protein
MPTIGQTNLNNAPTDARPLTGAELARQRWEQRAGFVPEGCDSQGRIEAAHAATEVGAHPQRRRTDPGYVGKGAYLPLAIVLGVICAAGALHFVLPWLRSWQ